MKFGKRMTAACLCVGLLVSGTTVYAKDGLITPDLFGFGEPNSADGGTAIMIEQTGLEHLYYTDENGTTIPYWIYVPKNEDGTVPENLPLVVFLHGHTDGGDNAIVIEKHFGLGFRLLQERNDPNRQAIILMPQTPENLNANHMGENSPDRWINPPKLNDTGNSYSNYWSRFNWDIANIDRSANLNAAYSLIQKVQKENRSDEDRAYLMGLSMGGCATWDLLLRDNDRFFAAAIPLCGMGDPSLAENTADVPIRAFHGGADETLPASASRNMVQVLQKYGNIAYTEYPGVGHHVWYNCWSPTLDDDHNGVSNVDELIAWLFNQSRKGPIDRKTDTVPLRQLISKAREVSSSQYSAETLAKLSALANEAQSLVDQENPSKEECDDLCKKISRQLTERTDNLCYEKPVYPSATYCQCVAKNVVDGQTWSYWDGGSMADNAELTIDLTNPVSLDSVKAVTFVDANRNYQYEIYGSLDRKDWQKIAEKTDSDPSTAEGKTFTFNGSRLVRYLKIKGTGNTANDSFHVAEMEAYGSHEALDYEDLTDQLTRLSQSDLSTLSPTLRNRIQDQMEEIESHPLTVTTAQVEIETKIRSIQTLLDEVENAPDVSLLEQTVQKAKSISQNSYTAGPELEEFVEELEKAQSVLSDPKDQDTVDRQRDALHNSMLSLRLIPDDAMLMGLDD